MEKRNIIITYILLIIIIIVLLIMVFYYKGLTNKVCPKCENNNTSTTTETNQKNNELPKEENVINIGKTLWNNTYNLYWNFMKNIEYTEISLGENKINNMNDF